MITNIKRNRLGTTSFDGLFDGMRKAQDFIVYPVANGESAERLLIQSDTRIGYICMHTGSVQITRSIPSGAYQPHLGLRRLAGKLTGEELLLLKTHVANSASFTAGTNGVIHTENSGAVAVLEIAP